MNAAIVWINENSGVISAILSVVTVGVAIIIPWSIAKYGQRIMLFDHRYEAYSSFVALKAYSNILKNGDYCLKELFQQNQIRDCKIQAGIMIYHFSSLFASDVYNSDFPESSYKATALLTSIQMKVSAIPYIFGFKDVDAAESDFNHLFEELYSVIIELTCLDWNNVELAKIESIEEHKTAFGESVKALEEKYEDSMCKALKI